MRGSRPGERRGGRQKGAPNKKTAYMRAVMVALSAGPKVTPMDLMLGVMRDPHVAFFYPGKCRYLIYRSK